MTLIALTVVQDGNDGTPMYLRCEYYSELQWIDRSKYLTQQIRQECDPNCADNLITYCSIIFN